MADSIYFTYNPFKKDEYTFFKNGQELKKTKLDSFRGQFFQQWVDKVPSILIELANDDIELTFNGLELDYYDLEYYVDLFNNNPSNNCKITLKAELGTANKDRLEQLKHLFEYMQQTTPFDDLKDATVVDKFEKALSNEFEVAIIATMSSGKSTLINSLLHCELLPSKNEACTATIGRIKDNDQLENFTAYCTDKNGDIIITKKENVDAEMLSSFNENPEVSYIHMEGNIPFVKSNNIKLVLLDTPGPNNSRDASHQEKTHDVIKYSDPIVLYILNATQLSTEDDSSLLTKISEQIKKGGKQSLDRFIFVVNKVDAMDPQKESIADMYDNAKSYLKEKGIETPNIYLTSASMAKSLRMKHKGLELTDHQEDDIYRTRLLLKYDSLHLEKYAPLSKVSKMKIEKDLESFKEDKEKIALIHTGIPALELSINEYIEKYAIVTKIMQAVGAFKAQIEAKEIQSNIEKKLEENKEELETFNKHISQVEEQINKADKANEFRESIKRLDILEDANKQFDAFYFEIDNEIKNFKPTDEDANNYIYNFENKIKELEPEISSTLNFIINETVRKGADNIIKEYQDYIKNIFKDISFGNFDTTPKELNIVNMFQVDSSSLIDNFIETKQVYEGKKLVFKKPEPNAKAILKAVFLPFTMFSIEKKYREENFVNLEALYVKIVGDAMKEFDANLILAKDEAFRIAEEFKKYFLQELNNLEKILKDKLEELKYITSSKENLEKHMEINKKNDEWLKDFIKKLDSILDINIGA